MQSVIKSQLLDINSTVITNPKLNKNKQLTAAIINNTTRSAVYIETPYLIAPFGLSAYEAASKGVQEENKSWSIVLKAASTAQTENKEDIEKLFNYLKALDEKAIDYGLEHSQTIFKKKYDESQRSILVDLLYNRCVKPSVAQDGTVYPDKITLKVMKNNEMLPDLFVYKDSNDPLQISSWDDLQNTIPKGSPIKCIIQPRLYFVNGKFGINFRVLQIKLLNVQKIGRPLSYAFSDEPESESSLQNNKKIEVLEDISSKSEQVSEDIEVSDSDEDVNEEDA